MNAPESYALNKGEPVITHDIVKETRFDFPDFMKAHGVVAIVNVPIFLPSRRPFGLLQVDAREPVRLETKPFSSCASMP